MKQKKVLVIIPDGVSLRNFLFTDFPKKAKEAGLEIIYWNATPYDISSEGEREIKLRPKPRAITDLYKRAKINSELNHFREKFNDPVYEKYKFAASNKGWKNKVKNLIISHLSSTYTGEEGLKILRERMQNSERKSAYYQECKKVLEREQPDVVFCANQRPVNAIASGDCGKGSWNTHHLLYFFMGQSAEGHQGHRYRSLFRVERTYEERIASAIIPISGMNR